MENQKVQVKGGKYAGKSWCCALNYKITETEVDFGDSEISFLQGSGFAKAKNKMRTNVRYNDITSVSSGRKYSIPNVVIGIFFAILGLLTGSYVIVSALLLIWLGRTAVVKIGYAGREYKVPTEFLKEAQELESKINTAIIQARA